MTKSGVEHLAQHPGWKTRKKSKPKDTGLDKLRRETELKHCPKCGEPLVGMQKAADEIAAEFIHHKRAADWAIINNAYLATEKLLRLKP